MNWYTIAKKCEKIYGTYVDWDEEFFICPECDEPIYRCDWRDSDYTLGKTYHGEIFCPVCEELILEE